VFQDAPSAYQKEDKRMARAAKTNVTTLKLTQAECDTIIAALRLWQRSPAYPEIEIAEEHGNMLDDNAIDELIEDKINR
jgi:hypothetical protein